MLSLAKGKGDLTSWNFIFGLNFDRKKGGFPIGLLKIWCKLGTLLINTPKDPSRLIQASTTFVPQPRCSRDPQ